MPTKIAIIHDWLLGHRGGEKVLEAILELFPDADIFTLFYNEKKVSPWLGKRKVTASFLNRLPGVSKYYRYLLPLFPYAIESFDLTGYQFILSSSHCVAKGVIPDPGAKHFCYCHTPVRYVWDKKKEYFPKWWQSLLFGPVLHYLRGWDVTSSHRVDSFAANSRYTSSRIEKYYRRESIVIPPFVDDFYLTTEFKEKQDFYLVVSALVPYKKIEVAIEACLSVNRKLVVVGSGPEESKLRKLAGNSPLIQFVGYQSAKELSSLYSTCLALLFPGEEDFGITPLEAMASGTPIIALEKGGALETVIPNETGLFFQEPKSLFLAEAILDFEKKKALFQPSKCRERAREFSRLRFQKELTNWISRGNSLPPDPKMITKLA
jgi:glycosyltransferase involved in cell wall biosynthesis